MPRDAEDLYPEEIEATQTAEYLVGLYDKFFSEARRLQREYADQIELLVGFEGEWIRQSSMALCLDLMERHKVDVFVGSVHHILTHPIDLDRARYEAARDAAGGTDELLAERYFDAQYEMLQALRPPVIGHFDLIRLFSDDPDRDWRTWRGVWGKIVRNLEFVNGYGALVEINGSALRKGLNEPYPRTEICSALMNMGGRVTLSDDSHSVEQVGLNYDRVLGIVRRVGFEKLHFVKASASAGSNMRAGPNSELELGLSSVTVDEAFEWLRTRPP